MTTTSKVYSMGKLLVAAPKPEPKRKKRRIPTTHLTIDNLQEPERLEIMRLQDLANGD